MLCSVKGCGAELAPGEANAYGGRCENCWADDNGKGGAPSYQALPGRGLGKPLPTPDPTARSRGKGVVRTKGLSSRRRR